MWQQGQVFKLKGVDGQSLWAYRYRLEGRGACRSDLRPFDEEEDSAPRKGADVLDLDLDLALPGLLLVLGRAACGRVGLRWPERDLPTRRRQGGGRGDRHRG